MSVHTVWFSGSIFEDEQRPVHSIRPIALHSEAVGETGKEFHEEILRCQMDTQKR